jgi:hypothetical protein
MLKVMTIYHDPHLVLVLVLALALAAQRHVRRPSAIVRCLGSSHLPKLSEDTKLEECMMWIDTVQIQREVPLSIEMALQSV